MALRGAARAMADGDRLIGDSRGMRIALFMMLVACGGPTGETTTPVEAAPVEPAPAEPAPTEPPPETAGKERMCPEAWYLNAMPGPPPAEGSPPREYLVVGGARRELAEFDMEWIKANCPVNEPQTVH
jgi:hypothetical protein